MHVKKQHTTFSSLVYFCLSEYANFAYLTQIPWIQPLSRQVRGFSFLAFSTSRIVKQSLLSFSCKSSHWDPLIHSVLILVAASQWALDIQNIHRRRRGWFGLGRSQRVFTTQRIFTPQNVPYSGIDRDDGVAVYNLFMRVLQLVGGLHCRLTQTVWGWTLAPWSLQELYLSGSGFRNIGQGWFGAVWVCGVFICVSSIIKCQPVVSVSPPAALCFRFHRLWPWIRVRSKQNSAMRKTVICS